MKNGILFIFWISLIHTIVFKAIAEEIRWNGFASIGAGISTGEALVQDGSELRLYGYDDNFNFRPESKLALQASSRISDDLSVTAQVISRGIDEFDVTMEWAFASYDFGDASRLNLGKLRIPLYHYSDFLDVGFSYPWIRPPESVYDLFFSTVEGMSVQFSHNPGNWDSNLLIVAGRTTDTLDISEIESTGEMVNNVGAAWNVENDWFSVRAAYFQAEVTISNALLDSVDNNLIMLGFDAAANRFSAKDDKGSFVGLGFKIDKADWFVASEMTIIELDNSFVPTQDSVYFSVGKRVNKFTFHVTLEQQENDPETGITEGIPFPTGTALDELVLGAEGIATVQQRKDTRYTFGLRYNLKASAAIKVEYTQARFDSYQTLDVDNNASVLRFSLDFLF